MKIVHCINHYMPLMMAGTEVYTHTLATMQKSLGHEVAVVTPFIDYYNPGQINEHYLYEGIDVYQYLELADPNDRQIQYGNKKPSGLQNFKQLIEFLKPDVIHFQNLTRSMGLTIENIKIAKQYGSKVIFTAHLSGYTCYTNVLVRNGNGKLCDGLIRERTCSICTYRTLYHIPPVVAAPLASLAVLSKKLGITKNLMEGKATSLLMIPLSIQRIKDTLHELVDNLDQFVSYTKWYEKILLENGVPQDKITVVPTAFAGIKKSEHFRISSPPQLPVKIVFIGRIQPQKGIHLIIEAMRHFSSEQVQIDLYGKTEETGYYNKCVKDSLDLENIIWKGTIPHEEVCETIATYDILCLPSTFSEMSSLVIQDAFAAGVPVLASKVYGNMEQVKNNINGLLFEVNSAKDLKNKIKVLIDNPQLLAELKENVKPPIAFDIVNECYLQLYESLIHNNSLEEV